MPMIALCFTSVLVCFPGRRWGVLRLRARGRSCVAAWEWRNELSHIVYITEIDISVDNGPGINEREFVRSVLCNCADEVVCICPEPEFPQNYRDERVRYVFNHRKRVGRYGAHISSALRELRVVQKSYAPAAVICRLGLVPVLPWLIGTRLHVPLYVKTLAGHAAFSGSAGWRQRAVSPVMLWFYRRICRAALGADTVCETYREWISQEYGIAADRVRVVANGANTDHFAPRDRDSCRADLGLDRFECIVGYVGALAGIRGIDVLIRSLLHLDRGTGLVLVGTGPDTGGLRDFAVRLGVADRVVFAGKVSYADVPGYMGAFDVAVDLTTVRMALGEATCVTSFSQKIAQYLAMGLPVLAPDTADTRFIASNGLGAVVDPSGEAGIASAVKAFTGVAPEERRRLQDATRRYAVANLSAGVLAEQRIRWLRELLRSGETGTRGRTH